MNTAPLPPAAPTSVAPPLSLSSKTNSGEEAVLEPAPQFPNTNSSKISTLTSLKISLA